VTPDEIVCLDCGFSGKMIRRHLTTAHGLSVEQYRERWGLAPDYPVVAPNYAVKRSRLAKEIGLGTNSPEPAQTGDPVMFGIVLIRSIGVLCGLGALLLTAFLAWVLIALSLFLNPRMSSPTVEVTTKSTMVLIPIVANASARIPNAP
jgi:hypothetical protein